MHLNFRVACGFRNGVKTILLVSIMSVALFVGFCVGTLYVSTWMSSDDGDDGGNLPAQTDYIIFLDDTGLTCAMNGSTGRIDYENTSASYVINSAMRALPTAGGYIFIKEGTYTVSETIKIPSNVNLAGAGFGTRLALAPNLNINLIENADHGLGNQHISIAHLQLDGNKVDNPGTIGGLHFKRVRNSTIQNCWIHSSAFAGLLLEKGGGNVIQGNFAYANRNAGIEGTHEEHDIVANNVVHSNEGHPYGHGIDYCTGSRYNVFDGNACYNNGLNSGGGLALWDGTENTITGNTLTSNYVGLTIGVPSFGNHTHGNIIVGNTVSKNIGDGLHIEGENNLVTKNTFAANGGNGVYINGSDTKNIIIEGNHLENNQGWQIHVTTFPSDTLISNNIIFGDDLITDYGVNTSIRLNTGYITENSGTATIHVGHTNVSVEHQLVAPPAHINLAPRDNLDGRGHWFSVNSTHLTVYISSIDTTNEHSFDWSAKTW